MWPAPSPAPRTRLSRSNPGLCQAELLLTAAILGLITALGWVHASQALGQQAVEATTRLVLEGVQKARAEAERTGLPCAMALGDQGWQDSPVAAVDPCRTALGPVAAGVFAPATRWRHNGPAAWRFTATGLVLDGGLVVVWAPGVTLRRCVVMALPLGVLRHGVYGADPEATLSSDACRPEAG
jgi:hypothetical protein